MLHKLDVVIEMARAKQFDRDSAIDFVLNEIWRCGYQASSVKAISEKLGITRSSYYNAFGSREGLFIEVLEKYARQSPDYDIFLFDGSQEPLALITSVFRNAVSMRIQDKAARGCLTVNSIVELVGTHEELGRVVEQLVGQYLEKLSEVVEFAIKNGKLNNRTDPRTTAGALLSHLMGLNMLSKVIRSEEELWKITQSNLRGLGVYHEDWDSQLE